MPGDFEVRCDQHETFAVHTIEASCYAPLHSNFQTLIRAPPRSDLYDRNVHDRLVSKAFEFCESEARKHGGVVLPGGGEAPFAGAGGSGDNAPTAAPVQPVQPVVQAPVAAPATAQRKPRLPILIDGVFKASLGPSQTADRKTFVAPIPWQAAFKPGASCEFITSEFPSIKFKLSSDPSAINRTTNLTFSLPAAFQPNEISLSGLRITAFSKQKKAVAVPPPVEQAPAPAPSQPKRPHNVPQPKKKSKKAAAAPEMPEIAADAPFTPAEGTAVLPCPAVVNIESIKGALIAHRFAKQDWPQVWAAGGKVLRASSEVGYFEVKVR